MSYQTASLIPARTLFLLRRLGWVMVTALSLVAAQLALVPSGPAAASAPVSASTASHVTATSFVTAAMRATAPDGSASDEADALAQASRTGEPVEVISDRTETDTVWANPDGTLTSKIASDPIRVPDAAGDLVPINLDLQAAEGRLAPKASATDVSFSSTGEGSLATLDTAGKTDFGLSFDGGLAPAKVSEGQASYDVSGTDNESLTVSATSTGFSSHVMLPAAPTEAPVYSFGLELHGLSASLEDGELLLKDDAGTVVARSAPLMMWDAQVDAAGDPAHEVPVAADLQGRRWRAGAQSAPIDGVSYGGEHAVPGDD